MVCDILFDAESYLVNMSDGASVYTQSHPGIQQHHAVNHSEHEWTRPEHVLSNCETGETRLTLVSTNFLDSDWQKIKSQIPQGVPVRIAGEIKTKMNYVRSAQWRMLTRGEDKWVAWCQAVKRWRENHDCEPFPSEEPSGDGVAEDGSDGERADGGVATGFKCIGEWGLLMHERQVRAGLTQPPQMPESHCEAEPPQSGGSSSTEEYEQVDDQAVASVSEPDEPEDAAEASHVSASSEDDQETRSRKRLRQPAQRDAELHAASIRAWGSRYFEDQRLAKCGQHALNNLLGQPIFDDASLATVCDQLLLVFRSELESDHRRPTGWYSHTILAAALDATVPPQWKLCVGRARADQWNELAEEEHVLGALVNVKQAHWTAICKEAGDIFYVDSLYSPVLFHQHDWKAVLKLHPDTFLIVKHDCDIYF